MSSFSMIVSIVPHDKGENLTAQAVKAGCPGGTVLSARQMAKKNWQAVLGLGESTKDLILMIVETSSKDKIVSEIKNACSNEKKNFGELFVIGISSFIKTSDNSENQNISEENLEKGETKMAHELISVIVNKGYADDAMAAARSAGAGGGTVINARGTAREDDEQFFGVHIVPEKEMLIILVESEKKQAVLDAVRNLKCLSSAGSGVAFTAPVTEFAVLGKK